MEKALKSAFGGSVDDCLDVSGKGLTCVYFKEVLAFFRRINLSNNHLKSVKSLVPYLLQCKELKLDGNHISDDLGDLSGLQVLYIYILGQLSCALLQVPIFFFVGPDFLGHIKNSFAFSDIFWSGTKIGTSPKLGPVPKLSIY